VIAAASALGMHAHAAELAAAVCERVYGYWDARRPADGQTLPGIACEFWPLDGRCGGEGYGWGAFTTHLLLRYIVGLYPSGAGYALRPMLPAAWRAPDRSYDLHIVVRNSHHQFAIRCIDDTTCAVTIDTTTTTIAWGESVAIPIRV
jgi:hypothetical protein